LSVGRGFALDPTGGAYRPPAVLGSKHPPRIGEKGREKKRREGDGNGGKGKKGEVDPEYPNPEVAKVFYQQDT